MTRDGGGAGGKRGRSNGGARTAVRRQSAEEKELDVLSLSLDDSGGEDWGETALPEPAAASGVRGGGDGEAASPFSAAGPADGRLGEGTDAGLGEGGEVALDSSDEGSDEGDSDESEYDDEEEDDLPYLENAPLFERGVDACDTGGCTSMVHGAVLTAFFCANAIDGVRFACPRAFLSDQKHLCAAVLRVADAGESALKISAGLLVSGARAAGRGAALGMGFGMSAFAVERDRGTGAMGAAQQVSRLCWALAPPCELSNPVLLRYTDGHLATWLTLITSPTTTTTTGCDACLAGLLVRIFAGAAERCRARAHPVPKG
jgi:hypothetical protein